MRKLIDEIVRYFTFASNRLRALGKLHWRSAVCAFLISCAAIALASPLLAQVPVTLVAREGDPAPGAGDGVVFEQFFAPSINNANEVVFAAIISGTGVTSDNKDGIWTGPPGSLQLLARDGDPAPGLAEGVTFLNVTGTGQRPILNQAGEVTFLAELTGPGVTADNDRGIWVGKPGSLQLVAREGDPAPGTSDGARFGLLLGARLAGNGHLAFLASLVGDNVTSANDAGFWAGPPGAPQLVAREGDPAPGTPAGTVFSLGSLGSFRISINGLGEVAFNATLTGTAAGQGIWSGAPGNVSLVIRRGDPAPGTPAGVEISGVRPPFINDAGEVAFGGSLTGSGVTTENNAGTWAGPPGNLQLVLRQGDPAPGGSAGETIDLGQFPATYLNPNGLVSPSPGTSITGSGVTTDNDQAVWFGPPGGLQMIAREGDPAPGTVSGTTFAGTDFAVWSRIALNGSDRVLFESRLSGGGSQPGDSGIWLASQSGVELLLRTGDVIEFAPGQSAIVTLMQLISFGVAPEAGLLGGLNDQGHVVQRLTSDSQEMMVVLPALDASPVADAGADQSVDEGTLVTLDGSGSTDPQGDPLGFQWTQLAGPAVTLDLSDPVHPTFVAPFVTANVTLTFELVVDDGVEASEPDTVDVTVINQNNPPVADAGDDSTIKAGATGQLDGSNSFDPEGDPIDFDWNQVAGSAVILSPDDSVAQPTFVAPVNIGEVLVFKLVVDDGLEASEPSTGTDSSLDDTVAVTIVENSAPAADAGPDLTKDEGSTVALDGSGSDPDLGDSLSFQWTQVSGSPVVLSDPTVRMPSFTAPAVDEGGEMLVFELVVSDDDPVNPKSSAPDDVIVSVRNINDPPSCRLAVADKGQLWPPNHKMIPVGIDGVMDTDSVYNMITLTITGITQDEPVNGTGDGDSSPDAVIQPGDPSDTVLIRAERAGGGDGRLYTVSFTASDGFESCSGLVEVTVPHSRRSEAVDSGQAYDSTLP